jgi:hypothetical protein
MNFSQLTALARIKLSDEVAPHRLTDNAALLFLQEAETEACRRARLLVDSSTAAICTIAVVAGTALYALDSRVLAVRAAYLSGKSAPLTRWATILMDQERANWQASTGTPNTFLTDYETGHIRLYPIPTANATLSLRVSRLPLTELTEVSSPEIHVRYHQKLLEWVVYRMRSIEDSELYDPRKAQVALGEFEAEFGPARSAWNEVFEDEQPEFMER